MARLVIGTSKAKTTPAVVRDKSPICYIEKTVNNDGRLVNAYNSFNLGDATDIGGYVLNHAYTYVSFPINTTIDFSSLVKLTSGYSCDATFSGCSGITSVDLSSLEDVTGNYTCQDMFRNCIDLTTIDLSSLISVTGTSSCASMFSGCTGITNVDLSSLSSVKSNACGSMFQGCTGITSIDLSSLISVTGCQNMFQGCTSLTSVDLSLLTNASGSSSCQGMFYGCTNLSSVNLLRLCKLGNSSNISQMFRNTALTTLSFPGLAYTTTNINSAFQNTLQGVTGCTVHFPSDWQTDMSSYSNITNGLGGTNTTVLFDLPAITTLDLSHITNINDDSMYGFASNNYFPNITTVNLSSLETVSGNSGCYNMFKGCTGITNIDLSSLKTISGSSGCRYMFQGCTGLTTVNLSSLETISSDSWGCGSMFQDCTGLTTVDLSSLETISNAGCQNMFNGCTSLTSLSFPALKTVANNYVFASMLAYVTGCTVHFPSNLSSYGFDCGGTNTTVLYDLPATA